MRVTSFFWASLIAASLGMFQERFPDTNSAPESDHYFVAFVRERSIFTGILSAYLRVRWKQRNILTVRLHFSS